jgi:hypothetical protein
MMRIKPENKPANTLYRDQLGSSCTRASTPNNCYTFRILHNVANGMLHKGYFSGYSSWYGSEAIALT